MARFSMIPILPMESSAIRFVRFIFFMVLISHLYRTTNFNSLPDNKIPDSSKLLAFQDNNLNDSNVTNDKHFVWLSTKHGGKRRKFGLQHYFECLSSIGGDLTLFKTSPCFYMSVVQGF